MSSSIGMIGGADGPAAIFISVNPAPLIMGMVIAVVIIVAAAVIIKRRKGR